MMYAKLALRNVKRSAKDYLIYVITLILSVGLFYGFMSIASPYYNESLPVKINLEILNKAMRIAVPIVALLVVFLISYVNTYMLRRKQKEFAVQTIIGMEQRTVAFIFFVETMIMGQFLSFWEYCSESDCLKLLVILWCSLLGLSGSHICLCFQIQYFLLCCFLVRFLL